jgi:acyl-CoA synthetase (AMP-forming)/AMP-acid ligase II
MRLVDYLDKGASLGPDRPCLTTDGTTMTYADVQALSHRVAAALVAAGVAPGETVAILSANDPVAFSCVFGISRAGAGWCPVNPRHEAAENRELLDLFDCSVLIYQASYAPLVDKIRPDLPKIEAWICLDGPVPVAAPGALTWDDFLAGGSVDRPADPPHDPAEDDLAMIVGTGGTTGRPKGVMLTGGNLETMRGTASRTRSCRRR